jgi:hypothetical protein
MAVEAPLAPAPVASAPPPKPAAAPAPSPAAAAPKPAAAPPPAIPNRLGERSSFFSDEDELPAAVDAEQDKPEPDAAPLKDDDETPKPDAKADDKPTDTKLDEPQYRTNRELKKAYEANKKELKRVQDEHAQTQVRLAELEQVANNAKGDTGPLAEQLAAAQKRIEDYEGKLRLTSYQQSDEFRTKYFDPFKRAETRAFRDVKQLEYIEGIDEDTQQPRIRPATDEDFIELYNLPTGKAYAFAKRAFGDSAQLMMNHYHALHQQKEDMDTAVAEYRTRGAQEEQQTQARTAQEREAADRMWRTANQDLQSKYFKELGVNPDDAEMKELLGKSYGTVDKLFGGNGNLTMAEKVGLQASVRQRAALFGVTRKQLLKAQSDLAEANKTIEELRGSGPGKPKPKADAAPTGKYNSLEEEMAAYPMET